MFKKVFNPYVKAKIKEPNWVQKRCPKCNALLFEINEVKYHDDSVRVKCRLCKTIDVH